MLVPLSFATFSSKLDNRKQLVTSYTARLTRVYISGFQIDLGLLSSFSLSRRINETLSCFNKERFSKELLTG